MDSVYLSKTKYCKAKKCKKILWMDEYKSNQKVKNNNETVLKNGIEVGILAKQLFGKYEDVEFNENLKIMIKQTNKLLINKPNIITEASFSYNNNFCSVDILKNDKDGVELYEVKSSTTVHEIYIDDVAYQYYILTNLGFNVKKTSIVYINSQYIRHGQIELEKLFNIEDVTKIVKEKQEEIELIINDVNSFMNEHKQTNEPNVKIGMQCMKPYNCEYWEYCTKNLPKPNVFDIASMPKAKKFQKYNEGKIGFEDLKHEKLNAKYLEQIEFELNSKEPKIEIESIKELINSLKYPLYFIDFETFQLAIPEYEGTKPYEQLPFQYSLHIIENIGAKLKHKEFLADIDDKNFIKHFAQSLIKDIPNNGSVIIYNNSFEPARINEIAKMYPEFKSELMRINSNMVDFLKPFRKRNYYAKEMQGSYSIKHVLPALYPNDTDLNYKNLPVVHNGKEAAETFLSLKGKTKEEQKVLRDGLLVYCKLDTLAMVKIWEKFIEIVEGGII